jgi:Antitoxin-like ribbon-helix-helix
MAAKRKKQRATGIAARAPKPDADAKRFRGVLARVNHEGLRELRLLAVERDTTIQSLAVEALNDLLRKYGRRPMITNPLTDQ